MKKKNISVLIITIVAFLIVIVELFPIIVVILNGFKRDMDIWSGNPFDFKPTLQSYISVLTNEEFLMSLKNSAIIGGISTLISLIIGAMASYGITRYDFKGKDAISYFFLTSRMIPQMSLAIPFYMMFRFLNLTDNLVSIILAHISFNIPYVTWLLLPFFASVSKEYEEAARVDGCPEKQIFWKIFVPLVAPGMVVSAVFAFLMSWNEFIYALVLTGSTAKTAPISVNSFMGQYAPKWGELSAAGTIMMIPVFIVALTLQKYIIRGLTAGGVKE